MLCNTIDQSPLTKRMIKSVNEMNEMNEMKYTNCVTVHYMFLL